MASLLRGGGLDFSADMPEMLRERGSMRVGGRLIIAGGCVIVSALVTLALYEPAPPGEPKPEAGSNLVVASSAFPPRGTLWLLAIGVSRYNASELNLQFADVDARAIADHLTRAGHSGIYRDVQKMVLTNEEVTRESILDSLTSFLGQAGADDIAMLFVAGHGVRDLASGSYYFLPHPATGENLLSEGLRVSDFDEMLRLVRRNVRAVVVMLDTCHAGSLGIPSARVVSADEMAAQMSAGQDFFLLAATKPGEQSKEKQELGHGAFTYALLEALRGAADGDGDRGLSVSELFGYVARRVPNLTQGQQHPYHKTEGTDLILLSVTGEVSAPLPQQAIATPVPTATPDPAALNVIGVMEFQNLRADTEYEWISKALRVAFNTELSKVRALRVYSPELIDRATRARGADTLYTARELGIGRLLIGAFHVTENTLRIDARIVDASTGVNEASDSVEGDLGEFFDLQKQLVLSMLRRLRVQVLPEEGASIETQTNTDVNAYRLLLEAEGIVEPPPRAVRPSEPEPQSGVEDTRHWLAAWFATAHASEMDPLVEEEVRDLLEGYRQAIEAKNIDAVAVLYRALTERQQGALRAYMQSANDLNVKLTDVTVIPHGSDLAVSFTRRDSFTDSETGKPVRLEVRLTKILVREGAAWKIGASE